MKSKLSNVLSSVILSGIILLVIGFYFCIVKGGIPYQDPTIEMQIQWKAYHVAGECNMKVGVLLVVCGVLGKIVASRVRKIKGRRGHSRMLRNRGDS